MRYLAGSLGGVLLALALFALLALLVAPPDQAPEAVEPPAVLSVSDALAASSSAPPPAASSSAPMPPAPPPPAPLPSPVAKSDIRVPQPEPEKAPPQPEPEPPKREKTPPLESTPEPAPTPAEKTPPSEQPAPSPQNASVSSDQSFMASAAGAGNASDNADAGPVGSPQPTHRVPPKYPPRAQRRGLEGYVEVSFIIRPDGSVDKSSLEVTDASPRRVFERAALRAVADWRFSGASTPRRARQRLEFKLEG